MANIPDDYERKLKMIEEASKSLKAYNDLLNQTRLMEENINHVKAQRKKIDDELQKAILEEKAVAAGLLTLTQKQKDALKLKIKSLEYALSIEEDLLIAGERELSIRREAIAEVKAFNLILNTTLDISKRLGKEVLKHSGYFLTQQKAVKETELSMGILSNQSNGFRSNIYKTSISTNQLGVNVEGLAKLQGTYADNVGRAVQLSEDQLTAVAEIGRGTMLGTEASAELASNFETIGISARGTADFVNEVLETSTKMGVTNSKVLKTIQQNLKLVNKFNFVDGVKGLGKMATLASKFKFEMQSIANFAEELMTPEGAVEVAAKLQVLGGEWAKLGDPFELMYRSRNDLTGLTEDIIEATTKTARFNELTGEFRIDPMEMSRLREISKVIGISVEELSEMSKTSAKLGKIKSLIPSVFDDEDKEYLSSLSIYNAKSKQFEVTVQTKDGRTITEGITELSKITPELVKSQRKYTQTLEERAKQSMTFNERFENLTNTFKNGFLPAFEVVAKILEDTITALEPTIKWLAEKIAEWPKATAGIIAGLALFGEAASWILHGKLLRVGFNMGGPLGGGTGGAGGAGGAGGGNVAKSLGGRALSGLKGGAKMGAGMGAMAGFSEWNENSEAGMSTGENLGRSALVGGGGVVGGALAGAALGSVVPVIGTLIGGMIGGALGAWGGDALGDKWFGDENSSNQPQGTQYNDFVSRPGENPINFSSSDTLIGAKTGGPIDKMIEQNRGGNTSSGNVSVDFSQPLKIEGKLELSSNGNQVEIDLNNPILMRDLAKMVQIELSKAISGGKINSNPVQMA